MAKNEVVVIPLERIQSKILLVRGQKVMLDSDLAELYGTTTGALVQAVKRNLDRFPADFMFQLSNQEVTDLKSQIVISKSWGGRRRALPYVFTEQGVAMLASVLRSRTAVLVNIQIVRSFVKLRELLYTNEAMARRVAALEQKMGTHEKVIVSILRELEKPEPILKKRKIGF